MDFLIFIVISQALFYKHPADYLSLQYVNKSSRFLFPVIRKIPMASLPNQETRQHYWIITHIAHSQLVS